jgi:hypothetical protein
MGAAWPEWLARALATFFLINAGLNVTGFKPVVAEFSRWKLPPWFPFFNAAFQSGTAVLLAFDATREYGPRRSRSDLFRHIRDRRTRPRVCALHPRWRVATAGPDGWHRPLSRAQRWRLTGSHEQPAIYNE